MLKSNIFPVDVIHHDLICYRNRLMVTCVSQLMRFKPVNMVDVVYVVVPQKRVLFLITILFFFFGGCVVEINYQLLFAALF